MPKFNRHEIMIFVRMPPINHDFKNLKSHKFHFCNHFSIIIKCSQSCNSVSEQD